MKSFGCFCFSQLHIQVFRTNRFCFKRMELSSKCIHFDFTTLPDGFLIFHGMGGEARKESGRDENGSFVWLRTICLVKNRKNNCLVSKKQKDLARGNLKSPDPKKFG